MDLMMLTQKPLDWQNIQMILMFLLRTMNVNAHANTNHHPNAMQSMTPNLNDESVPSDDVQSSNNQNDKSVLDHKFVFVE